MIRLLSPEPDAVISLATERQKYFREHSGEMAAQGAIDWLHLTEAGETDCTFPLPVRFTWENAGAADILELSETPDFAGARRYPASDGGAAAENLRIGAAYYWRVGDSEIRRFTTEALPPRFIHVDGTTNVRDLGGWTTADGKTIKQGLLYRGAQLDKRNPVTPAGLTTLRDELGIRTDLDLRGEVVGVRTDSPLGESVRFCLLPIPSYASFLKNPTNLTRIFALLADRENYPLYCHCWGGADRTATLCLLIGALCGLAEEDLLLDYEFTSLSIWGCRSRSGESMQALLAALQPYGSSTKERVEGFLLAHGVADRTIEAVRSILVE